MELTASNKLLSYAEELEMEYRRGLSAEERVQADKTMALVDAATRAIISSHEKFTAPVDESSQALLEAMARSMVDNEEVFSHSLDEQYSRLQLEKVSSLVERTKRLTHLARPTTPSKQTNLYIGEASRAYIQGFELASVAMSRAALEQALKEKLRKRGREYMLGRLITEAERSGVLSGASVAAARSLAERCNSVLHDAPIKNADDAYEIVTTIRSLLEEIYSR
jgi:hypothetical protein